MSKLIVSALRAVPVECCGAVYERSTPGCSTSTFRIQFANTTGKDREELRFIDDVEKVDMAGHLTGARSAAVASRTEDVGRRTR